MEQGRTTDATSAYRPDDPLGPGDPDEFSRAPTAARIASSLRVFGATGGSSVAALVGGWGTGKSSILAQVEMDLKETSVSVTSFTPWLYPDLPSLQAGFLHELKRSLPREFGDQARDYRQTFSRYMSRLAPLGSLGLIVGVDARALTQSLADVAAGQGPSLSEVQADLSKDLSRMKTSVVMLLDDLDRLDPAELLLTLKLIRLVGRLPNVCYLLAYDEETLLDILCETPLVGRENQRQRASEYLQKLVQARFDVPPLNPHRQLTHLHDLLQRLPEVSVSTRDQQDRLRTFFDTISPRLENPRYALRLVNHLGLRLASSSANEPPDAVDLLALSFLELEHPQLHAALPRQRRNLISSPSREDQNASPRSSATEGLPDLKTYGVSDGLRDEAQGVLQLVFPRLARLHRTGWNAPSAAQAQEMKDGVRLHSADAFDNYFSDTWEDLGHQHLEVLQAAADGDEESITRVDSLLSTDPHAVFDTWQVASTGALPTQVDPRGMLRLLTDHGDARWAGAGQSTRTARDRAFAAATRRLPTPDSRIAVLEELLADGRPGHRTTLEGLAVYLLWTRSGEEPGHVGSVASQLVAAHLSRATDGLRAEEVPEECWALWRAWRAFARDAAGSWLGDRMRGAQQEPGQNPIRWDVLGTFRALVPVGEDGHLFRFDATVALDTIGLEAAVREEGALSGARNQFDSSPLNDSEQNRRIAVATALSVAWHDEPRNRGD